MNINPKIEKIFSTLKIDEKQIPIAYLQYFGTEDKTSSYAVFDTYLKCVVKDFYPGQYFYNIPIEKEYIETPNLTPFINFDLFSF